VIQAKLASLFKKTQIDLYGRPKETLSESIQGISNPALKVKYQSFENRYKVIKEELDNVNESAHNFQDYLDNIKKISEGVPKEILRELTPRSRSHFLQKNSLWSVTKPEAPRTPALEDNKVHQDLRKIVVDLRKSVGESNQPFFNKRNSNINRHISPNSTSDQACRKQFVRVNRYSESPSNHQGQSMLPQSIVISDKSKQPHNLSSQD